MCSGFLFPLWVSILSDWVEVVQSFPTQYRSRDKARSRTDWVWICGPSSLIISSQDAFFVISSPESCLSDHAPLVVPFS